MQKMLLELLDLFDEYKNDFLNNKKIVCSKKNMYEDLIGFFRQSFRNIKNSENDILVLLEKIYENKIFYNDFLEILSEDDEELLENLYEMIKKDYNLLLNEFDKLDRIEMFINENINNIIIINDKINKNVLLNDSEIEKIKNILVYFSLNGIISGKDFFLYLNEIEFYNQIDNNDYNLIPNMLNFGVYNLPKINFSRGNILLEQYIKNIIALTKYEDIITIIENYRDTDSFNKEEYECLILSLLNHIANLIYLNYKDMVDSSNTYELYINKDMRKNIIDSFYYYLNMYQNLLKYYDELNRKDNNDGYIILFSSQNFSSGRVKLLEDMKRYDVEKCRIVYERLKKFQNGNSSDYESISIDDSRAEYGELKHLSSGLRIILQSLGNRIYVVLGVFKKEGMNDSESYKKMGKRDIPNISLEDDLKKQIILSESVFMELKLKAKFSDSDEINLFTNSSKNKSK